jgi:UDP:flavonoid glycosyltransferase YjiC (YdhE family)
MTRRPERKRILFIAEDVTLAQVVRLEVLSRTLDPSRYDLHFACASFPDLVFRRSEVTKHLLSSTDRAALLKKVDRGARLYERDMLQRYVKEELALYERIQPHAVIADLRFSVCVSAPHAGIPYASLINAYWSRHMVRSELPMPDHPIVRLLGERTAAKYFPRALPSVLAHFAAPVNALRSAYKLEPFGDLLDVMMAGNLVLFPDVPTLTPLRDKPDHHLFLGPVVWSPQQSLPPWWDEATRGQGGYAYVTLGSSGRADCLPAVLDGMEGLGLALCVATAGRTPTRGRAHVHVADYLPGSAAAARAALVVCNGGSASAYQALAEGTPVLGIASNFDQFLGMSAIRDAGAGILLRASTVTPARVNEAARKVLEDPSFRSAATRVRDELAEYDHRVLFPQAVERLCGARP